jgi:LacI family transcriptional regulator
MATMDDVARAAQVSVSTVSHVINGTRKVHAETTQKVAQAIAALGYIPNSLARSLARSATSTIGVAIPALSNHYFAETVQAIDTECSKHGLMMMLTDTHDDPVQELRVIQSLHQRRVDGILFAPSSDPQDLALKYLKANQIPTVLVDRLQRHDFDQVGVENVQSTAKMITHLIEHGHRRIGFLSGTPASSTSLERLEGYHIALELAGIAFEESLVECGFSSIKPAQLATKRLLNLKTPPTAIMASNNLMIIGAMHTLRDLNIDVPKDIALVGFDDFDWAGFFNPRLTVISQPLEKQGSLAVQLLIQRIQEPEHAFEIHRLEPKLMIRDSCGCGVGHVAAI